MAGGSSATRFRFLSRASSFSLEKINRMATYWVRRVRDLRMNIHPVEDITIQAGLITVYCDRFVAAALKIEIDL